MILGSAGLSMLVTGTVLACIADRYVGRTAQLQFSAGIFIIGGFSIIGAGLAWAIDAVTFVSP